MRGDLGMEWSGMHPLIHSIAGSGRWRDSVGAVMIRAESGTIHRGEFPLLRCGPRNGHLPRRIRADSFVAGCSPQFSTGQSVMDEAPQRAGPTTSRPDGPVALPVAEISQCFEEPPENVGRPFP